MKLKVLSLNIWYGRLLDNAIEFLNSEDADIILLQEVYDGHGRSIEFLNSLDILKEKLTAYKYNSFSPAFFEMKEEVRVEQGQAIFSKFPIESNETIYYVPFGEVALDNTTLTMQQAETTTGDFTQIPRNLQYTVVNVEGKKLNLFNTQGVWGFDGFDNPARLAMSKIITESVTGKENVILAGDFNFRDDTQSALNIEKILINVFKGQMKTSFNMIHKHGGGFGVSVVDMFYISSEFKVLKTSSSDLDVSDHLPLIVELELK